ncbi:hypothetical protein FB451DRAFT_1400881 [Mycena latifolia]|nr:hypothetical protein FB451DRAFT_1400881 [Mycena latifolia]
MRLVDLSSMDIYDSTLDINPPTLMLLTDSGTSKDDVDLPRFPAGLAASLQAAFARGAEIRVQTVTALGEEGVVAFTEESEEAAAAE